MVGGNFAALHVYVLKVALYILSSGDRSVI